MSLLRSAIGFAPSSRVGLSAWRRFASRFDWVLLLLVVAIAVAGLVNLYSATHRTPHAGKFDSQLMWMALGAIGFFVVSVVDYHVWRRLALVALVLGIVAIASVRLFDLGPGAQRWIPIFGLRVQPSEFAKIAVILAAAHLIVESRHAERHLAEAIVGAILIVGCTLLIAVQPDLGTSIVAALIVGSMGFLILRKLWPIAGVTAAAVAMLPVLWNNMHGYQQNRVRAFLDPAADPTGIGWHTQQSIFAVGSGRIAGKGFLGATQNHFNFLPEYWTDFPFSVWAEEWGFIGSVLLLLVYAFLVLWIVNVALKARDAFGAAICIGVGAMIFWHVVINVAMVLGIAPIVGLTLPLVSYGGSSVVAMLIGLGLVSSVSMRRAA